MGNSVERKVAVLVEDDKGVAKLMQIILSTFGYRVLYFDTAEGTPRQYEVLPYVFFIDKDCPKPGTGAQAFEEIREIHPNAEGILYSGDHEGGRIQAERLKMSFLPKPFGPADVGMAIRDLGL